MRSLIQKLVNGNVTIMFHKEYDDGRLEYRDILKESIIKMIMMQHLMKFGIFIQNKKFLTLVVYLW